MQIAKRLSRETLVYPKFAQNPEIGNGGIQTRRSLRSASGGSRVCLNGLLEMLKRGAVAWKYFAGSKLDKMKETASRLGSQTNGRSAVTRLKGEMLDGFL